MKLSKETLAALKYLATVNSSIMIKPENVENDNTRLFSRSETHALLATVLIAEKFDKPFITTDLPRFLSIVSLFEDPEFDFAEDMVTITDTASKQKMVFYYSPVHLVEKVQSNKLPKEQPNIAMSFSLSKDNLEKIKKASDMLGCDDIVIYADKKVVKVAIMNPSVDTSNSFEIEVEVSGKPSGKFFFKKTNLRVRETDYSVSISDSGLMEMIAQDGVYAEEKAFVVANLEDE